VVEGVDLGVHSETVVTIDVMEHGRRARSHWVWRCVCGWGGGGGGGGWCFFKIMTD
jgi:hypothetical protein